MRLVSSTSLLAVFMGFAATAVAQEEQAPAAARSGLEEVIVTAQKRATSLQDASLAVSAVSGESIERGRLLSFEDIANTAPALSFTALSPLDQEFNIRGITNTRLDSPSADQSIGIFLDEVFVGRSGLFNSDLFDIERVEVIRGPQGVLLGRNVVGGAISIITAAPSFDPGGAFTFSYGNYDERLARGHVTGQIAEGLAGRLSFQSRNRGGFAYDILNDRELENIESVQFRGQLLYDPEGSDLTARLVLDYTDDKSNGFLSVAIDGPQAGSGPWSAARAVIASRRAGGLDIRQGLPEHPLYKGDSAPSAQSLNREAFGATLNLQTALGSVATIESVTGWRRGEGANLYDQTGIGPDNGFVVTPTLFSFPVNERENIKQFTQEVRIVSDTTDSRFDWIVGAYYQSDEVDKVDRFWAEVPFPALRTLSGESQWNNSAENTSWAVFGQLGFRLNDMLRATAGVRYTEDEKEGTVTGLAVEGGDKFNPTDTVALTPLVATFAEGQSFTTAYGQSWEEVTPQATIEFTPNEDLLVYFTASRGYKGGGFEDTPPNAAGARSGYDPETVQNLELGLKWDFLDRTARINIAAFAMDYKDLQVTQTNDQCLCNITDNAADAEIRGIEAEFQYAPNRALYIFGGGSFLETEYLEFIDSTGVNNTGKNLQRTPEFQYSIGAEVTTSVGAWRDALSFRLNYAFQGQMYWTPDNNQKEQGFGLVDGRIALAPEEAPWSFSIWGRNLTDEVYRTNIIAFFGDEVSRLGAPRTYGAELSVKF